jgi:hypothetical protein
MQVEELDEVLGSAGRAVGRPVPDRSGDDLGAAIRGRHELPEPVGRDDHVGVGERQEVPGGVHDRPVAGRGRRHPRDHADHTQAGVLVELGELGLGVGAHHDDHLKGRVVLGQDAGHAPGQGRRGPVGGHDH